MGQGGFRGLRGFGSPGGFRGLGVAGGGKLVSLPRNLILSETLLEDFEVLGDWTAQAGSIADNTTEYKVGTHSIKLTSSVGSVGRMYKTVNWDMSSFDGLYFWFYVHSPLASVGSSVQIHLSETTNFATYWTGSFASTYIQSGWNVMHLHKSQFSAGAGSPNWANPIIRLRMQNQASVGNTLVVSFDGLYLETRAPAIMLTFDDGYISQHTALTALHNARMAGTLAVTTDLIDTAGFCTAAQLVEMDGGRHSIVNHTNENTSLSTLSEANQEINIAAGKAALDALGLTRSSNYLVYPGGNWNADTFTAMAALGVDFGRTIIGAHPSAVNVRRLGLPWGDNRQLPCKAIDSTITVATVEGWIDTTITQQHILHINWHNVGGVGQWTAAQFDELIAYIQTKRDQIHVITLDDLYKAQSGAIAIPAF